MSSEIENMSVNNITSNKNRLKGVENRKKNLSPLFELNKCKQKRDKLEATKQKIELEISNYNVKIKELLCQFGICDLVKSQKTLPKSMGNTLPLIVNFLKEKNVPVKCTEIIKSLNRYDYGNIYQIMQRHDELFEQLPDKTWKLK